MRRVFGWNWGAGILRLSRIVELCVVGFILWIGGSEGALAGAGCGICAGSVVIGAGRVLLVSISCGCCV